MNKRQEEYFLVGFVWNLRMYQSCLRRRIEEEQKNLPGLS